jgi:hypothetical protein
MFSMLGNHIMESYDRIVCFRCCCKSERVWKRISCNFVLGSHFCCVLHGGMDYFLSELALLSMSHPATATICNLCLHSRLSDVTAVSC